MLGNKNRGWIGVDLGEHAIKIAQLRRSGDRLALQAAAVYPRSGLGLSEDLVGATMLAEQAAGGQAAASLSMAQTLVEPHDEAATPGPDRCWDTWSAGQEGRYLLSVQTRRVEATLDGLASAGLVCDTIDGAPQAIARAVQLTPGWRPDELLGVLDWGESTATLIGAEAGVAKYVRRLRCEGFGSIRSEVASSLQTSVSEADKALQRWGIDPKAGPQGRRVAEALRSATHPVAQEVSRTLEHLRSKLKNPGPSRLVALGVGATVPGLVASLGERVGLPAEAWRADGLQADGDESRVPDCLLAQAIALSALAWEAGK